MSLFPVVFPYKYKPNPLKLNPYKTFDRFTSPQIYQLPNKGKYRQGHAIYPDYCIFFRLRNASGCLFCGTPSKNYCVSNVFQLFFAQSFNKRLLWRLFNFLAILFLETLCCHFLDNSNVYLPMQLKFLFYKYHLTQNSRFCPHLF